MLRLAVEGNGVYKGFYDCFSSKEVFRISGSVFWLWGFLLRVWGAGVLSFGSRRAIFLRGSSELSGLLVWVQGGVVGRGFRV